MTKHEPIKIKPPEVLEQIRNGGALLGVIRNGVAKRAVPGITSAELDAWAEHEIIKVGGVPSFKGYGSPGEIPFPTCLCVSINNEVVHGPAIPSRTLKKGDVVGFDIGMQWPARDGYYTDTAVTVAVGGGSREAKKLIDVTKKALAVGISAVKPGGVIADIGAAIEQYVKKYKFGIVRELVGHGVGYEVHEAPMIPNYFDPRVQDIVIQEGMVLAIVPMITIGNPAIKVLKDGWTVVTRAGGLAAHFEHTIIVGKRGAEIVT